jgi:cell wall-associated NlpC family hydrolase
MRERRAALAATLAALALGALASGCAGRDAGTGKATAEVAGVEVADVRPAAVARPVRAVKPASDDAEAAQAYATPAGVKLTKKPPAPGAAKASSSRAKASATGGETKDNFISPGAPTDAEIARELKQMEAVQRKQAASGGNGHGITLEPDGTAKVAPGVPEVVARIVAGANAIAKYPYVYGGGHGSFDDTAYDCSGSLSYALAAGGLLTAPKTSGELARTGAVGPGKWITIYANAGHTFMYVDGLRYDTSGRGGPLGTRWSTAPRSLKGFVVRHPPGL